MRTKLRGTLLLTLSFLLTSCQTKPDEKGGGAVKESTTRSSSAECKDTNSFDPDAGASKPTLNTTVKAESNCSVTVTVTSVVGVAENAVTIAPGQSKAITCQGNKNVKHVRFECLDGSGGKKCEYTYKLE